MSLKTFEPVIAGVITDDGAVLMLDETVVILPVSREGVKGRIFHNRFRWRC
jgi:hypothetical protein